MYWVITSDCSAGELINGYCRMGRATQMLVLLLLPQL